MPDPAPLLYLSYIAVMLLLGILCTALANKIKIANVLLLIVLGLGLGFLTYKGAPLISFPLLFLTSIATLALVMIVFDSSSRLKLKQIKEYSIPALKLTFIFLLLNLVVLSLFALLLFPELSSIFLALVFGALMSGTDPAVVLFMFKGSRSRIIELLEIESILNTPVTVLIPFIFLDMQRSFGSEVITTQIMSQVLPFLQQIVTGIGAGILVGIIILRIMKTSYSETLSPLAIITSALIAYILAENLKGNGVLAVTVMGLFFGNFYVKEKEHLAEFSSLFANALEILVFVLVGLIINIPLTKQFFLASLALFGISLIIRYLAIHLTFTKLISFKQKLFMALNVQKGIALAVVVLALTTLEIPGIGMVSSLMLAMMLYSLVLATVISPFAGFLVNTADEQNAAAAPATKSKQKTP